MKKDKYCIVTTLCDKKEVAEKIPKTLLKKRLVAGSQISIVKSSYWWKKNLESKEEFKIEFRTREDKVKEVVYVIKSLHNYEVPEISETKIECLTDEMKIWIDESIEQNEIR